MTSKMILTITLIASLALAAVIALVYSLSEGSNQGFAGPAAALTFISGAAVGIERVIEGLWTVVGGTLGSYWPLNAIKNEVEALTGEMDKSLKTFHQEATAKIDELKKAGKLTSEQLQRLQQVPDEIKNLETRFADIKNLAPGNQRVQLLAAAAAQNVKFFKEQFSDLPTQLEAAAATANSAIDGIQNFIATFKDNPGRRLISIYLGAILGLVLAGVFSLDLFTAAGLQPHSGKLSIILTGIIMGLGSNPTHEVIRLIQERKESQKGANAKQPDLP